MQSQVPSTKMQEIQAMVDQHAAEGFVNLVRDVPQFTHLFQTRGLARQKASVTNSSDATPDNAARDCFRLCTLYNAETGVYEHNGKSVKVEVELTRFHGLLGARHAADLSGCNLMVINCSSDDGEAWRYKLDRGSNQLHLEMLHAMVRIAHRLGMRPNKQIQAASTE